MKFTKAQLIDLVEHEKAERLGRDSWRHGHMAIYVIPYQGAFYLVNIPVHHSEGWQVDEGANGTKVEKKEVVSYKWVVVQ